MTSKNVHHKLNNSDIQVCGSMSSRLIGMTLLTLSLCFHIQAQSYETHLLDFKDQYLGATSAITSDLDGFVWLSTSQGLMRFDGSRFINIKELIDSLPIGQLRLQTLYVDSYNQLWCFRYDRGLLRVDLKDYSWKFFPEIRFNEVSPFYYQCHESDDKLYFPHPDGMALYDRDDDRFDIYRIDGISEGIRCIDQYKAKLILASGQRVFTYDLQSKVLDSIPALTTSRGVISTIAMDEQGYLWSATWYNPERGLVKIRWLTSKSIGYVCCRSLIR